MQEELQRRGLSLPSTSFPEQSSLLVIIEVLKLLFLIMITPVLVWRVPDDRIEKPNLAEEDGDEKRGPRGVGGRRQYEGDPRGHREHRGGEVVDPEVFRVPVHKS